MILYGKCSRIKGDLDFGEEPSPELLLRFLLYFLGPFHLYFPQAGPLVSQDQLGALLSERVGAQVHEIYLWPVCLGQVLYALVADAIVC